MVAMQEAKLSNQPLDRCFNNTPLLQQLQHFTQVPLSALVAEGPTPMQMLAALLASRPPARRGAR